MELHKLKLDEKGIWLDDMLLQGVRAYFIRYNSDTDIDELTLHMDTRSWRGEEDEPKKQVERVQKVKKYMP